MKSELILAADGFDARACLIKALEARGLDEDLLCPGSFLTGDPSFSEMMALGEIGGLRDALSFYDHEASFASALISEAEDFGACGNTAEGASQLFSNMAYAQGTPLFYLPRGHVILGLPGRRSVMAAESTELPLPIGLCSANGLIVSESRRGRGLGSILVLAALAWSGSLPGWQGEPTYSEAGLRSHLAAWRRLTGHFGVPHNGVAARPAPRRVLKF